MIEINKLQKIFDNGFEALKSVSFSVEDGDLICLLGPSGCGKTTILNLIAGLLDPTSGTIDRDGESMVELHPKDRDIGFVFQNYALYPHMTVLENIMFPLSVGSKKIPKDEAAQIARKFMKLTQIEDLEKKKPATMSGGQQQRICIARAIAMKPEVILMDEPTSALDPISTSKVEDLIEELKKDYTIVIVTHNMQQAARISDETAFFLSGVLVECSETKTMFTAPQDRRTEDYITGRFG